MACGTLAQNYFSPNMRTLRRRRKIRFSSFGYLTVAFEWTSPRLGSVLADSYGKLSTVDVNPNGFGSFPRALKPSSQRNR